MLCLTLQLVRVAVVRVPAVQSAPRATTDTPRNPTAPHASVSNFTNYASKFSIIAAYVFTTLKLLAYYTILATEINWN